MGYFLCIILNLKKSSSYGQVPGSGACVRGGAVRLPGQERSPHPQGGTQVLPTNHLRPGLLSQSQHMVTFTTNGNNHNVW